MFAFPILMPIFLPFSYCIALAKNSNVMLDNGWENRCPPPCSEIYWKCFYNSPSARMLASKFRQLIYQAKKNVYFQFGKRFSICF